MVKTNKIFHYKKYRVKLVYTKYISNNSLAVVMVDASTSEPITNITSNISNHVLPNTQFVDINNNPGIEEFLQINKLAKRLDYEERSGYCTYPLYQFYIPEESEVKNG